MFGILVLPSILTATKIAIEPLQRFVTPDIWKNMDEKTCWFGRYQNIDEYKDRGFYFPCYDEMGTEEGCKRTKHKTKANTNPVSLKGRAEEELERPAWMRCKICGTRYDLKNNGKDCRHHPGL